jgi:hypothetical protein
MAGKNRFRLLFFDIHAFEKVFGPTTVEHNQVVTKPDVSNRANSIRRGGERRVKALMARLGLIG